MGARSLNEELLVGESARVPLDDLSKKIRVDPRAVRLCCGRDVQPRLAEIRDSDGASLFVSVWWCPRCDRATL